MVTETRATEITREPQPEGGSILRRDQDDTVAVIVNWAWLITNAATTIEQAARSQQATLTNERRAHFRALADWWHVDTDGMSSDRQKFQHEAYQRILTEIGRDAVPFMLTDLEQRGGHWYTALQGLTGQDFNTRTRGNLKQARRAWLSWGKANPLI